MIQAVLLLMALPRAAAWEPVLKADLSATYWGIGLAASVTPGVQQRLWGEDGSLLFGDTFVRAEWIGYLTPAYGRTGPKVTFSPIAIFETSASCLGGYYFGNFSTITGFGHPADPYDPGALEARLAYRDDGWNTRCGADATLQAMVGPVIAAAWGGAERWTTWPGERVRSDYFFEPEVEVLISMDDTFWHTDGVLLYQILFDEAKGRTLVVGDMTTWRASADTGDRLLRTGLMAVYSPKAAWTVLFLLQPYLWSRTYGVPLPPYVAAQVGWKMPSKGS